MTWEKVIEEAKEYRGDIYGINEKLRNHFNKVFLYFLKKHNVTQLEIAKALNKTPVTINNWAKNRVCPALQNIIELKAYFDKLDASEI